LLGAYGEKRVGEITPRAGLAENRAVWELPLAVGSFFKADGLASEKAAVHRGEQAQESDEVEAAKNPGQGERALWFRARAGHQDRSIKGI
jgi:hypothetical protein